MRRPKACEHCSKKLCVTYTFVQQEQTESFESCETCPILLEKLHKIENSPKHTNPSFCSLCHTTFEDIAMGKPVGCPECFALFEEKISQEIKRQELIPQYTLSGEEAKTTFSLGKTPHYGELESMTILLSELRKALNNALHLENYEEAAVLRDKIKQINT